MIKKLKCCDENKKTDKITVRNICNNACRSLLISLFFYPSREFNSENQAIYFQW